MAAKKPTYRLPPLTEATLNPAQRGLLDALRSGPRGPRVGIDGPFGCYMHAPEVGQKIQELAAFVRFNTRLEKRLSEFAILAIGRIWKAQYEFFVHAGEAERAGVLPKTVADLKAGRLPTKAPKDERAIYDFVAELYKTRRVGNRNYKRVAAFLDEAAIVELVGILGYYAMISMTLNIFGMLPPESEPLPFAEPKV